MSSHDSQNPQTGSAPTYMKLAEDMNRGAALSAEHQERMRKVLAAYNGGNSTRAPVPKPRVTKRPITEVVPKTDVANQKRIATSTHSTSHPSMIVPQDSGNCQNDIKRCTEKTNEQLSVIKRRRALVCTACVRGCDAELLHPRLNVPVCGLCAAAWRSRDVGIEDGNELSCVWCGGGDGVRLLFCDSCRSSYCAICVRRNFGERELERVIAATPWQCYECVPPESSAAAMLKRKQISPDAAVFYSMEAAYSAVRPPKWAEMSTNGLAAAVQYAQDKLSHGERSLACILTRAGGISGVFFESGIWRFLTAADIFIVTHSISGKLRRFFSEHVLTAVDGCIPGLFETPFGRENGCQLFPHQKVSLRSMLAIERHLGAKCPSHMRIGDEVEIKEESATQDNDTWELFPNVSFGTLRGGIFADEPGLGKTVTVMALIACTAGTMPTPPPETWDEAVLENAWQAHLPSLHWITGNLLARLTKFTDSDGFILGTQPLFVEASRALGSHRSTLTSFEAILRETLHVITMGGPRSRRNILNAIVDVGMNQIRASLDPRQRVKDARMARIRYERSLLPSWGTLIVVPLALLEHWYEQLMRHLSLEYFTDHVHMKTNSNTGDYDGVEQDELKRQRLRGIVWLDGLGDLVDVTTPLSKLSSSNGVTLSPELLAQYLIVVTTAEQCAADLVTNVHSTATAARSPLLHIRWLRLIVDEGHSLGALAGGIGSERSGPRNIGTGSQNRGAVTATNGDDDADDENGNDSSRRTANNGGSLIGGRVVDITKSVSFIASLAAERRWVMSGTPTTGARSEVGLTQLLHLLSFLRHPKYASSEISADNAREWQSRIVRPCVLQREESWAEVRQIFQSLLVRHTKAEIALHAPLYRNISLSPKFVITDEISQRKNLAVDRAKAQYIAQTLEEATKNWKASLNDDSKNMYSTLFGLSIEAVQELSQEEQERLFRSRRPKALVFSQNFWHLQGVTHMLYQMLGQSAVCEHVGEFRSAELSRFRHSAAKYRHCPLCGFGNPFGGAKHCRRTLLAVEYTDWDPNEEENIANNTREVGGSDYTGRCLCSFNGCDSSCRGLPNAFYYGAHVKHLPMNRLCLVRPEDVIGYTPGQRWTHSEHVRIMSQPSDLNASPLFRNGVRGGPAIVRAWQPCGGTTFENSWHGPNVLNRIPWITAAEDTKVLTLMADGAAGLDLSFATHLFLLERIADPALKSQIVSRAHRVGATGPVQVYLLQTTHADDPFIESTSIDTEVPVTATAEIPVIFATPEVVSIDV